MKDRVYQIKQGSRRMITMNMKNEERDFILLKRRIYNDTSLDCHQYKDNYLKRRINVRMRAREL